MLRTLKNLFKQDREKFVVGGKEKALGFLVGQTMKEMKGKANPESVRETLMKEVEKRK